MTRRRKALPELRPVYVRPALDQRERAAERDWCRAAYCGERHRPKSGDFDPLWLRLGLRVHLINARAGWVVSNPIYDQSLRRNSRSDPSLPGPGWLREVYRWYRSQGLVTLPSAGRAIERRVDALRAAEHSAGAHVPPGEHRSGPMQRRLFSAEEAEIEQ